jgi:predicted P-loop ATPase/GTPase
MNDELNLTPYKRAIELAGMAGVPLKLFVEQALELLHEVEWLRAELADANERIDEATQLIFSASNYVNGQNEELYNHIGTWLAKETK